MGRRPNLTFQLHDLRTRRLCGFTEIGRKLLDRLVNDLREHAGIEQNPLMEGRQMVMMFAPKKK